MPTLTIADENAPGSITREMTLDFPTDRITVRELIRSRVYQEVDDHNRRRPDTRPGPAHRHRENPKRLQSSVSPDSLEK